MSVLECPLFPIAAIQIVEFLDDRPSANGQKRTINQAWAIRHLKLAPMV